MQTYCHNPRKKELLELSVVLHAYLKTEVVGLLLSLRQACRRTTQNLGEKSYEQLLEESRNVTS